MVSVKLPLTVDGLKRWGCRSRVIIRRDRPTRKCECCLTRKPPMF